MTLTFDGLELRFTSDGDDKFLHANSDRFHISAFLSECIVFGDTLWMGSNHVDLQDCEIERLKEAGTGLEIRN